MNVNERRLKVVYDALDDWNNKKAIQEVNKILKKDPNAVNPKILQAIALYRMGRQGEAESLIQPIESSCPTDESVLTALSHYYREAKLKSRFSKLLESVCKKMPGNEMYAQWLFTCYVRDRDITGQLQTARNLCKTHPENDLYFFFSVVSTLVQARDNPGLAEKMLYPLAEKMLQTMASKRPLSLSESLLLFELYNMSGRPQALLAYVDKHKNMTADGQILARPLELVEAARACLAQASDSDPEHRESLRQRYMDELHAFLQANPDDAQQWRHLIDCQFRYPNSLYGSGSISTESLLSLQQSLTGVSDSLRGPYLSKLHLLHRIHQLEISNVQCAFQPLQILQDFFHKFSSRPFCSLDMMEALTEYRHLIPNIHHFLESLQISLPSTVTQVADSYCLSNYETLRQFLAVYDKASEADMLERVSSLLDTYRQTVTLVATLPTEHNPGDLLLCLAVNLLFQCHKRYPSEHQFSRHLLTAAALLESVVQQESPSNHNLRLRLVRIYQLLGAYPSAVVHFRSLDVKQLLLESMSYLLTDFAFRGGEWNYATVQWSHMATQLRQSLLEVDESLTVAYKERNAKQIFSFMNFRLRLEQSLTFSGAAWLRLALEMFNGCHTFQQLLDFILDCGVVSKLTEEDSLGTLVDGRDFDIVPDPLRRPYDQVMKEACFQDELTWIGIRRSMCRCVAMCGKVVMDTTIAVEKRVTSTNDEDEIEDNNKTVTMMKQELDLLNQQVHIRSQQPIVCVDECLNTLLSPVASMAGLYSHTVGTTFINNALQLILQLRDSILHHKTSSSPLLRRPVEVLQETLIKPLKMQCDEMNVQMSRIAPAGSCRVVVTIQDHVTLFTEMVSITLHCLSMLHSCLMPVSGATVTNSTSTTGGGKKGRAGKKRTANKNPGSETESSVKEAPSSEKEGTLVSSLKALVSALRETLGLLVSLLQEDVLGANGTWSRLVRAVPIRDKKGTPPVKEGQDEVATLCQQFLVEASLGKGDDSGRLSEASLRNAMEKVLDNVSEGRRHAWDQLRSVLEMKLATAKALMKDSGSEVPPPLVFQLGSDTECGFFRR